MTEQAGPDFRGEDISVVIPTTGRATLRRAVESVLGQTTPVGRVVVCNDGDHPLDLPADPRVTVLQVGPRAGGNAARMAGVRTASSRLVALLDDDDRWRPDYVAVMLEAVNRSAPTGAWIAGSSVESDDGRRYPGRHKQESEDLLSYLFRLHGLRGKGALPTSTLLFPRDLALSVPWHVDLRFHQDLTWLVEVFLDHPDLQVVQVRRPLALLDDTPGSVSKSIDIAASLDWASRFLLTAAERPREYGDFLLSRYPLRAAAARGDWRLACRITREAVRRGRPGGWALVFAALYVARAGLQAAGARAGVGAVNPFRRRRAGDSGRSS